MSGHALAPLAPGRRWRIVPKRDFGIGPGFCIDGKWVKSGYVVTDGFCNVMPGAVWFRTVAQASEALVIYVEVAEEVGDSDEFWRRYRAKHPPRA